jgi:hypothetical protein
MEQPRLADAQEPVPEKIQYPDLRVGVQARSRRALATRETSRIANSGSGLHLSGHMICSCVWGIASTESHFFLIDHDVPTGRHGMNMSPSILH